jgi:S1-C subfamily serine protease
MDRVRLMALLVLLLGLVQAVPVESQDIAHLQAGVVKITATEENKTKVGTGFIVKLDPDRVYILTAAHVVGGDPQPRVEFFTNPNAAVRATVVNKEGEEVTSLALLMVQGKDSIPTGLSLLPVAIAGLSEGEEFIVIGHPQMIGDWAVLGGKAAKRKGRNFIVDANIEEGNSGGPMIKSGQAVGLVAGMTRYGLAVPAGSLREYLEGHRTSLRKVRQMWPRSCQHLAFRLNLKREKPRATVKSLARTAHRWC